MIVQLNFMKIDDLEYAGLVFWALKKDLDIGLVSAQK